MIKTKWHVITGGPSSGKTKAIEYLSFLGYPVVQEISRILIAIEKSKGKTTKEIRSSEAGFQSKSLAMKIDVENRIPPDRVTFFDRGIPDSIAYYKICNLNPDVVIEASKKRMYKTVFLLDQVPVGFEVDDYRVEDEELAKKLNVLLYEAYTNMGYKVIRVPVMPIDERVKLILSKTKE